MSETFWTHYQPSLWDADSATSSLASAAGRQPCGSQAGQTAAPSGPAHAPVNLSARQAKEQGLLTSGTYGRPGSGSYSSVALTLSLGNRLRVQTASLGSTLFRLTWKQRVTPLGRSICALRASVRRTSGSDCSSWPSPRAAIAAMSAWATPRRGETGRQRTAEALARAKEFGGLVALEDQAQLSAWPTPDTGSEGGRKAKNPGQKTRPSGTKAAVTLNDAAQLASWATPQSHDSHVGKTEEQIATMREKGYGVVNLNVQVQLTDIGLVRTGFSAETRQVQCGGQLNPAHSLWLQGYPEEWLSCGERAMQSSSRQRRKS